MSIFDKPRCGLCSNLFEPAPHASHSFCVPCQERMRRDVAACNQDNADVARAKEIAKQRRAVL